MSALNIYYDGIERKRIVVKKVVLKIIKEICEDYGFSYKNVSIVFTNDEILREINKKFLNKEYYTDIITFDCSDRENEIDTEIYISIDRIKENAEKFGVSKAEEFKRVIIHGLLHLVGEDDRTEDKALKMREKEGFYLNKVSRET